MTSDILPIGEGFWNLRGDLRLGGVFNVHTHASLVARANGKYLLLDACELSAGQRAFIDEKTNGGEALEAVLHLHPFHTLFVHGLHKAYPGARQYGTARHIRLAPDLPWQAEQTDQPALHAVFADVLEFSVPRGVDFIPENENLHFASVLAFHSASRTLHVDDTLCYVRLPWLLRAFKQDVLGFHPSLPQVLERRAGAVAEFREWCRELVDRAASVDNLCSAHLHVLAGNAEGPAIAARIETAVASLERKLAAHERRHG